MNKGKGKRKRRRRRNGRKNNDLSVEAKAEMLAMIRSDRHTAAEIAKVIGVTPAIVNQWRALLMKNRAHYQKRGRKRWLR
jgi:transposase-like protein